MSIKSVVTLVSDGLLCCRYCGHLFSSDEIPKVYKRSLVKDDGSAVVKEFVEYWDYKNKPRCPSCLHVLYYEVQKGLPSVVVWRNGKMYVRKK